MSGDYYATPPYHEPARDTPKEQPETIPAQKRKMLRRNAP